MIINKSSGLTVPQLSLLTRLLSINKCNKTKWPLGDVCALKEEELKNRIEENNRQILGLTFGLILIDDSDQHLLQGLGLVVDQVLDVPSLLVQLGPLPPLLLLLLDLLPDLRLRDQVVGVGQLEVGPPRDLGVDLSLLVGLVPLHLQNKLEPHGELAKIGVLEEVADVVDGQPDQHVEGDDGEHEEEGDEEGVGEEGEGNSLMTHVPPITKALWRLSFEEDITYSGCYKVHG